MKLAFQPWIGVASESPTYQVKKGVRKMSSKTSWRVPQRDARFCSIETSQNVAGRSKETGRSHRTRRGMVASGTWRVGEMRRY